MKPMSIAEYRLETAMLALAAGAVDGEGRRVNLLPATQSSEAIRKALLNHLEKHQGDKRTVFLGRFGEEAFWYNTSLLIDALQAALTCEGGSRLNQEMPW